MYYLDQHLSERSNGNHEEYVEVQRILIKNVVALFLLYDPSLGFLFEQKRNTHDPLYGHFVIPGGKEKNIGEAHFPLWTMNRECLEEIGIVAQTIFPLEHYIDTQQHNLLYPFLLHGVLWGTIQNLEPLKTNHVFIPYNDVFLKDHSVHPRFKLPTTRFVLYHAFLAIQRAQQIP